jgi:hypothetical protein
VHGLFYFYTGTRVAIQTAYMKKKTGFEKFQKKEKSGSALKEQIRQ